MVNKLSRFQTNLYLKPNASISYLCLFIAYILCSSSAFCSNSSLRKLLGATSKNSSKTSTSSKRAPAPSQNNRPISATELEEARTYINGTSEYIQQRDQIASLSAKLLAQVSSGQSTLEQLQQGIQNARESTQNAWVRLYLKEGQMVVPAEFTKTHQGLKRNHERLISAYEEFLKYRNDKNAKHFTKGGEIGEKVAKEAEEILDNANKIASDMNTRLLKSIANSNQKSEQNNNSGKNAVTEYPGPLGLKWGSSSDKVKSQVSDKLTFVSEVKKGESDSLGDEMLVFSGSFGGFDTQGIQMEFSANGLMSVAVALKPDTSLAATYEKALSMMKSKYGEPSRSPAADSTTEAATQSKWIFSNDTTVGLIQQPQAVLWLFFKSSALKEAFKSEKAKSTSSDF